MPVYNIIFINYFWNYIYFLNSINLCLLHVPELVLMKTCTKIEQLIFRKLAWYIFFYWKIDKLIWYLFTGNQCFIWWRFTGYRWIRRSENWFKNEIYMYQRAYFFSSEFTPIPFWKKNEIKIAYVAVIYRRLKLYWRKTAYMLSWYNANLLPGKHLPV